MKLLIYQSDIQLKHVTEAKCLGLLVDEKSHKQHYKEGYQRIAYNEKS